MGSVDLKEFVRSCLER